MQHCVFDHAEVPGARLTPVLTAVREEAVGGQYTLVLEFQVRRKRIRSLRTHLFGTSCHGQLSRAHGRAGCQCCRKKKHQGAFLQYC